MRKQDTAKVAPAPQGESKVEKKEENMGLGGLANSLLSNPRPLTPKAIPQAFADTKDEHRIDIPEAIPLADMSAQRNIDNHQKKLIDLAVEIKYAADDKQFQGHLTEWKSNYSSQYSLLFIFKPSAVEPGSGVWQVHFIKPEGLHQSQSLSFASFKAFEPELTREKASRNRQATINKLTSLVKTFFSESLFEEFRDFPILVIAENMKMRDKVNLILVIRDAIGRTKLDLTKEIIKCICDSLLKLVQTYKGETPAQNDKDVAAVRHILDRLTPAIVDAQRYGHDYELINVINNCSVDMERIGCPTEFIKELREKLKAINDKLKDGSIKPVTKGEAEYRAKYEAVSRASTPRSLSKQGGGVSLFRLNQDSPEAQKNGQGQRKSAVLSKTSGSSS